MSTVEGIALGVILVFGLVGLKSGLLHAIGAVVGLVVGVLLASRLYEPFASFLLPFFNNNEVAASLTSFILIFVFLSRVIGFLIGITLKPLGLVPGVGLLDALGGLAVGLVEGVLLIGIILSFADRLPLSEAMSRQLGESAILGTLVTISHLLTPLFPSALRKARELLPT